RIGYSPHSAEPVLGASYWLAPSGRRPSEPGTRPAGEPPAVTLQPRRLVEGEDDNHLIGRDQRLGLAAESAARKGDHGSMQLGRGPDVAAVRIEGNSDG